MASEQKNEAGSRTIAKYPCKATLFVNDVQRVGESFESKTAAPALFAEWMMNDVTRAPAANVVGPPPPMHDYAELARAKTVVFEFSLNPKDPKATAPGDGVVFEITQPAHAAVAQLLREQHKDSKEQIALVCVNEITLESALQRNLPAFCKLRVQMLTERHNYDRAVVTHKTTHKNWLCHSEVYHTTRDDSSIIGDGVILLDTDDFLHRTNCFSNTFSPQRPLEAAVSRLANPTQVAYVGPSNAGPTRYDYCCLLHNKQHAKEMMPLCPVIRWVPGTSRYAFYHVNALSKAIYDYYPAIHRHSYLSQDGPAPSRAHLPIASMDDREVFAYGNIDEIFKHMRNDLEKDDNIMNVETMQFRFSVFGPNTQWKDLVSLGKQIEVRLALTFHYVLLPVQYE